MNYLGVQHGRTGYAINLPIKELLLVDKVCIIGLDKLLNFWKHSDLDQFRLVGEFEKLIDSGHVFQLDKLFLLNSDMEKYKEAKEEWSNLLENPKSNRIGDKIPPNKVFDLQVKMAMYEIRGTCTYLRGQGHNAFPLIPISETKLDQKETVMKVVLKKLPVISQETCSERIIEFKSNPDSQGALSGLRTWVSEVSRGDLATNEIEDKLDYLLYRYRKALELHELKYSTGTLEVVIVTIAEVLENIAKFKWGELAQNLFSLQKKEIEFKIAEQQIPGNEISYIIKANEFFNNRYTV